MLVELSKMEQCHDAVLAVIRDGTRVGEVAEKCGVHRDTVHAWLAHYEAEGLEGLRDRSHRTKASPLQMPANRPSRREPAPPHNGVGGAGPNTARFTVELTTSVKWPVSGITAA